MPFVIFFLLISMPVIEVASIVEVSRWVGPLVTFLLIAASIAFGAFLIRSQSFMAGRRVMTAMQAGTPPEHALLDSGAIIFAGVLFMIPGFFSDILALIVLLPPVRRIVWRGVSFGMRRRGQGGRTEARPSPRSQPSPEKPRRAQDVIDVEFTEVPRDQGQDGSSAHPDSPWSKS